MEHINRNIEAPPRKEPHPAPLLYSYREARALLGNVPAATFALWIANGLLTPCRIGPRRCFIRRDDLLRLSQYGAAPGVTE